MRYLNIDSLNLLIKQFVLLFSTCVYLNKILILTQSLENQEQTHIRTEQIIAKQNALMFHRMALMLETARLDRYRRMPYDHIHWF